MSIAVDRPIVFSHRYKFTIFSNTNLTIKQYYSLLIASLDLWSKAAR